MKVTINYTAFAALKLDEVERILIDKAIITTEYKNEYSQIKPYWFKVNKQPVINFNLQQLKDLCNCLEYFNLAKHPTGIEIYKKVNELLNSLIIENDNLELL